MIKEIKTNLSAFEIFSIFKDEDHALILDSSLNSNLGRFSIICFNPFDVFCFKLQDDKNPFEILRKKLNKNKIKNDTNLPFIGGAVGYFSYDLFVKIFDLNLKNENYIDGFDMYFGFYDFSLVFDHFENKFYFASSNINLEQENKTYEFVKAKLQANNEHFKANKDFNLEKMEFRSKLSKKSYFDKISKIKNYIENGDVYQINFTWLMEGKTKLNSFEIYKRLRETSPCPFGAFLDFGGISILSNSPERFLQCQNNIVKTSPIKGTIKRLKDKIQDEINKQILLQSQKDRAELLMIVDLERNDLSKVCEFPSVEVDELFKLESYENVHHLVATIKGKLRENCDLIDLLLATFPGGSISGAPKLRALEIINELELNNRNAYTGVLGYLGFDGNLDLNILIRSIIKKDENLFFQVGGGITWDSKESDEYEECLSKASAILKALNADFKA